MTDAIFNKILEYLGFNPVAVCVAPNLIFWDNIEYFNYTSKEYLKSDRRETDEVYRMYESVLIHNNSGLRIRYTSHENYAGDEVEYKVLGLFVIDLMENEIDILDVDFEKRQFSKPNGKISFDAVRKEYQVND